MRFQSQIIRFKGKSGLAPGFLVMEILISLLFCFTFILILLRFHSDILLLYERFFVRNLALDLAVNTLEHASNFNIPGADQDVVYAGRSFKIAAGESKDFVAAESKKGSISKVVVVWQNSAGRNEKLTLGST